MTNLTDKLIESVPTVIMSFTVLMIVTVLCQPKDEESFEAGLKYCLNTINDIMYETHTSL